jgi:hypothetical protein
MKIQERKTSGTFLHSTTVNSLAIAGYSKFYCFIAILLMIKDNLPISFSIALLLTSRCCTHTYALPCF